MVVRNYSSDEDQVETLDFDIAYLINLEYEDSVETGTHEVVKGKSYNYISPLPEMKEENGQEIGIRWYKNEARIYGTSLVGESCTYTILGKTAIKVAVEDFRNYCKENLKYNGVEQVLTKEAPSNVSFIDNKGTNVGTYTVKARVNSPQYIWNDGTINDKPFNCTIAKGDNPIEITDNQVWEVRYSTSAQTKAIIGAIGAQGTLTYTIQSQRTGSTNISYFTISGTTLTMKANTPAGVYNIVVRASAAGNGSYEAGYKDINISVLVGQSAANPITVTASQSWAPTFSSSVQNKSFTGASNAEGAVTYSISSQKNSSNANVSYFSIPTSSTASIRMAANTPIGTYTVKIDARAAGNNNYPAGTKTITMTVTVGAQKCNTPTNVKIGTDGKITWTASSNCSSAQHQVKVGTGSYTNATSGVSKYSDIISTTGSRTVYVKAIAPTNYSDSSEATATTTVYSVTLTKGTGISSVSGNGKYISGETVTLGATASSGYTWGKWTQTSGGSQISTTNAYSAKITSNWAYTANAVDNVKPTLSLSKVTYITDNFSGWVNTNANVSSGVGTINANGSMYTPYYHVNNGSWNISVDFLTQTASTNYPSYGGLNLGGSYYDNNMVSKVSSNSYSGNGYATGASAFNVWNNTVWNGYSARNIDYVRFVFATSNTYSQPPVKIKNIKISSETLDNSFYDINITSSDNVGVVTTKYASGQRDVSYFASNGTAVTGNSVRVTANGYYTVYVADAAGNATVSQIQITNIVSSTTCPTGYNSVGVGRCVPNALTFNNKSISKSFSTSAQTASVTAASNGTGTYTYSEVSEKNSGGTATSYISVSGTTITIAANTPASTYTYVIRATDSKSGVTKDATYTITINKIANPIAVTASQSWSASFSTGAQTKAITAATGGQGTVTYAIQSQKTGSTNVSSFTISGTTLTMKASTAPGTYTVVIRATAAGNTNYNSGYKDITMTVTVGKATNTVTITPVTKTYTGSGFATTVTATSGTPTVTYYSDSSCATKTTTTNATAAGGTPKLVGTYYATATVAASTNYNAGSASCKKAVVINKATPTVTLTAKTATYTGSAIVANTATVSPNAGGAVTYTYYTNSACSTGATTTAPTNVGNYYVKATVAAVANKTNAGSSSCVAHTISKSNTTTSLSAITKTYTGSAQAASGAASKLSSNSSTISGAAFTYTYYTNNTCTTATTTPTNAGQYYVKATLTATTNYNSSVSSCVSYKMSKKATTMSLSSSSGTLTFGTNGSVSVITDGDGLINCSSSNTNIASCSVSGKTVTILPKANTSDGVTVTITVSQAEGNNYLGISKTYIANVNRKVLTCPSSPAPKTYTGSSQGSGITCPTGSSAGGTTSATNAGTYTQSCTPGIGYNFNSACNVNWVINSIPATLNITDESRCFYGAPDGECQAIAHYYFRITSNSDGEFSCSSSNESIAKCSIYQYSGRYNIVLYPYGVGNVTITFSQSDGTMYGATSVSYDFKTEYFSDEYFIGRTSYSSHN